MAAITPLRLTTRAVIFDLDGVLVWTVPMHFWAFQKTFAGEGRKFTLEEYMSYGVGAPREEVIRRAMGELAADKLKELMAVKETYVREYLKKNGVATIPGSLDFVRAVRSRSLKTAVASASRTPRLLLESVGTDSLFDAIVDRTMVARSKPDPDLYLLTAEKLGVPPGECLVIEDSSVGVEAALAADMRVLALTTTQDPRELARASAVYRGFAEIPIERWL